MALPTQLAGVSAQLITKLLEEHYPGVEVETLSIGDVLWGTATKVHLNLEYNNAGQDAALPSTMLLKAGLGSTEMFNLTWPALATEVRFFRDWAPGLDIRIPRCFHASTDTENHQSIVLMEDLTSRAVTFGSAPDALSPGTVSEVLGMLAQCHAKWWKHPSLKTLESYPGVLGNLVEPFHAEKHWNEHLDMPRGQYIPSVLRDRQRMRKAVLAMIELSREERDFFIHGDVHMGNLFFEADGSPGILDWQTIMQGPWAHDVAYFIVGSLSVEDRRANERELLNNYLNCLASAGGPEIGIDDAWLRYCRHALHEFMWVLTLQTMQPEEFCSAHAQRCAAALVDLDTLGVLGV